MANVDATIVGMIAECLESELILESWICAKTLTNEENDESSESAAKLCWSSCTSVFSWWFQESFQVEQRNNLGKYLTLIPSSIFIVRALLTLFELFVLLVVNLATNHNHRVALKH